MLPAELPLYYKPHAEKGNGGFPESFPFHVHYDTHLQMYRQKTSPELEQILHKVYEAGSLVEGSISNESGLIYLDIVLNYIERTTPISNKSILEIGCGNGALLKAFKSKG